MSISAADRAYNAIRARIVAGEYTPRQRLREIALAEEIGVSRTPVRDALKRLEAERYVSFVRNQGACVAEWSDEGVAEFLILRYVMESYAVELATTRISDEGFSALEANQSEFDAEISRGDWKSTKITALDVAFHRRISAAANNSYLEGIINQILDAPAPSTLSAGHTPEKLARASAYHRQLIDAMKARDARLAAAVMSAHVLSAGLMVSPPAPQTQPAQHSRRRAAAIILP